MDSGSTEPIDSVVPDEALVNQVVPDEEELRMGDKPDSYTGKCSREQEWEHSPCVMMAQRFLTRRN